MESAIPEKEEGSKAAVSMAEEVTNQVRACWTAES